MQTITEHFLQGGRVLKEDKAFWGYRYCKWMNLVCSNV